MNSTTDAQKLYESLMRPSRPVTARFVGQGNTAIRATFSQFDFGPYATNARGRLPIARKYARELDLDRGYVSQAFAVDEQLIMEVSGSTMSVKFRKTNKGGAIAEVWDVRFGLLKTFGLDKINNLPSVRFGLPLTDEWFGGGDLSPDEKKVVFVASLEYGDGIGSNHWSSTNMDKNSLSDRYLHRQSWGEGYGQVFAPQILVLDLETGQLDAYGKETMSYGQVLFLSDHELICTRWSTTEKMGLIYCYQRRSELVLLNLKDGTEQVLTKDTELDFSCRSPILIPNSREIIYLSRNAVGEHFATARLRRLPIDHPEKAQNVVDIVDCPAQKDDFPGIYATRLPKRCFLDKKQLVFTSQWGLTMAAIRINIENGRVERLSAEFESISILETNGVDKILGIKSSVNRLPQLVLYQTAKKEWQDLLPAALPISTQKRLNGIKYQRVAHRNGSFESLLLVPTTANERSLPLIIYPHGGPHSAFYSSFMTGPLMLASAGFAVVCCNYRGSKGYGEKMLSSLAGHIGEYDVTDCLTALDEVLDMGIGDKDKIAVVGGSHGGYLCGMLTALPHCSHRFKAAVMRNPVTDLTTMIGTSDIEDWVAFEAGVGENYPKEAIKSAGGQGNGVIDLRESDVLKLWSKSPMRYVAHVTAATLVLLGEEDARVPPSQGLAWVRQLRQRGKVRVECFVYPENCHPLAAPFADADVWVNTIRFLREELAVGC